MTNAITKLADDQIRFLKKHRIDAKAALVLPTGAELRAYLVSASRGQ